MCHTYAELLWRSGKVSVSRKAIRSRLHELNSSLKQSFGNFLLFANLGDDLGSIIKAAMSS